MSIKRVVIGYDGSACSDAVLLDLKSAGLPAKAEILVVSVAEVFMPPKGGKEKDIPEAIREKIKKSWAHAEKAVEDSKKLAEHAAARIKKAFPGAKVQAEAFADSPTWGILRKAKEWKADLIVLGAHGIHVPERILLGSVSQIIATQAPCSVRIVHGKPEENESPSRVVVGVDGSACSYAAIDAVVDRSWKKGSAVHFMTIMDSRLSHAETSKLKSLRKRIEDAEAKLKAKGCTAVSLNKEGSPKSVLLEESKKWGADSIFVGSRGLSGIKHILLGSVSAAVAARAYCSVEIVR